MGSRRRRGRAMGLAAALAMALGLVAGCGGRRASPPSGQPRSGAAARVSADKLVAGAVAAVSRFDDFDEGRAVEQALDRLAQWSHHPASAGRPWRRDSLLDTLSPDLREAVGADLDRSAFDAADVAYLRDRRWLADIARWARGDATADLDVACRLFAWTIRSLAIVGDPPAVPTEATPGTRWLTPGEILLAGRASGPQRTWLFVELLAQAGIDGVVLATGDAAAGTLRPWLPAAVIDGEAYLFETTYGMPVPRADGTGVATVREAAADAAVLAQLSLPDRPYPLAAADVATLSALVVADPPALSRRMTGLDRETASRHGVRLAVDAEALGRRARAALAKDDATVALWDFPWQTALRRPAAGAAVAADLAGLALAMAEDRGGAAPRLVRPLVTARVREFRGDLDGPEGAKAAYLAARPSKGVIQRAVQAVPPDRAADVERLYRRAKEDATYWLGVLTLAEGEHEAAVDYLERMTLEAAPDSRWTDAARTNLARALEALGRTPEAIAVLRADGSPQRFGSRLLADRLERGLEPRAAASP